MRQENIKATGPGKHQDKKSLMLVALRLVFLLLIAGGIYFGISYYRGQLDLKRAAKQLQNSPYVGKLSPGAFKNAPISVAIPALGIDTSIVPLDLAPDKELQVPANPQDVGWYVNSAAPGNIGAEVLVGHLDWWDAKQAVFYNLRLLKPGDAIVVKRQDGTEVKYKVDSIQRFSQDSFPTELVYGQINYPGLRLITCSGKYDQTTKHYSQNLVAFASLAQP